MPAPRPLPSRVAAAAAVAALALLAAACGGAAPSGSSTTTAGGGGTTTTGAPHLSATAAPYQLPAPVSREVVVSDGSRLVVLGGLDRSQSSVAGVYALEPGTGALSHIGQLARSVHDAAGAVIGGSDFVFGGGSPTTFDLVQSFAGSATGRLAGHLPRPRSDLAAATVSGQTYILGGYDGSRMTPEVLATTDGVTFRQVGSLPEPVRYPAVAAVDGTVYAFGGETGSGDSTAVQAVDTRSGAVRTVGRLPAPLSHAAAVALGGRIWIAGGRSGGNPTDGILEFDPRSGALTSAGRLPQPVADAGAAVLGDTGYLVGGEGPQPLRTVIELTVTGGPSPSAVGASAGGADPAAWRGGTPFRGRLLIADRGNNRLIVVNAAKQLLWTYPSPTAPPPPGGFYFPDDGFFIRRGTAILTNEEDNNTIVQLGYPSGRVQWIYGHPKAAGSGAGYLDQPDDAYLLADGRFTVADAKNCRILFLSGTGAPLSQIGTTGRCVHAPPAALGYPNGDTPLPNGDVLISEIHGSWISEYTPDGRLVWTVELPIAYPSDPQQLGPDLYLVADYSRPGGIYEFTREGRIVWSYTVSSGDGMLDHPSLAERLPTGLIATNDDYRHRVAIIDPATDAIVWQYGVTDQPGTGPDQLRIPDGFDLLAANGSTPTHPQTG